MEISISLIIFEVLSFPVERCVTGVGKREKIWTELLDSCIYFRAIFGSFLAIFWRNFFRQFVFGEELAIPPKKSKVQSNFTLCQMKID